MKFKHFLLTQWNVGLYGRKQKLRDKQYIVPTEWMESRWKLFTKYCVPSVANQKNKNFVWIVVVDPDTPVYWFDRIGDVVPTDTIVVAGKNFRQAAIDTIETVLSDEDRVVTSRCDNDDCIHQDFIGNIQDWFRIRNRTGVLTYPKGLVWNPKKDNLYHLRYVKNHFLTFIEKRGIKPVKTVLRARHTALTDRYKTFNVETDAHMWLEIIHDDNLANYSRGDKIASSKLNKQEFGL